MKRNFLLLSSTFLLIICCTRLSLDKFENNSDSLQLQSGNANTIQQAEEWVEIPGSLKQISVGNTNCVWGVNPTNAIYRWTGSDWEQIWGALKCVAIGNDGKVWGVNPNGVIYRRDGTNWIEIPGKLLEQISVGNTNNVWGIDANYYIYYWNGSTWINVPGRLKQVAVGNDGKVWGVNPNGVIYRRDGTNWVEIPGRLKQISVGNANYVWGVNPDNVIYRWTGTNWIKIDGALKCVAIGNDGKVWGVNPDNVIYRRDLITLPPVPLNLKLTIKGDTAELNWDATDPPGSDYQITCSSKSENQIRNATTKNTTYTFTNLARGQAYDFTVSNSSNSETFTSLVLQFPVAWGVVKGYDTDNGIDICSTGSCSNNRGGCTCMDYMNPKPAPTSMTMINFIEFNGSVMTGTPNLTKVLACGSGTIVENGAVDNAIVPANSVGSWYYIEEELEYPVYYNSVPYKYVWYMHLHRCNISGHQIKTSENVNSGNFLAYNLAAGYGENGNMEHLHFGIAQYRNRTSALYYQDAITLLGVEKDQEISAPVTE